MSKVKEIGTLKPNEKYVHMLMGLNLEIAEFHIVVDSYYRLIEKILDLLKKLF